MSISFNNTETAFASKSTKDLKRAYWLFKLIGNNFLVKVGSIITPIVFKMRFPVKDLFRQTIFRHFCGGESIEGSEKTIQILSKSNIGTILDYAAEGIESENEFENTKKQIIEIIDKASNNKAIPFSVFKITGLARFDLLAKIQAKEALNQNEAEEFIRVEKRVNEIFSYSFSKKVKIFIDAEESWIQDVVDELALNAMVKYNKQEAIVFNTLQLYRHDRLTYMTTLIEKALSENFKIGFKLVRGAYMEKERIRAIKNGYTSPIHADKSACDKDFNTAIKICIKNISLISFCVATHNEESHLQLIKLMQVAQLPVGDERIYSAQLYGMSDNISYNLSHSGYNVAKYVPFGPVQTVLPYLIRRAEENTSVAGQTSRELKLIEEELRRRRLGG